MQCSGGVVHREQYRQQCVWCQTGVQSGVILSDKWRQKRGKKKVDCKNCASFESPIDSIVIIVKRGVKK